MRHFTDPSPFDLYLPEGRGPFPIISITPILGRLLFFEDLFLEQGFARFFSDHGFATALIHRPIFEFDPSRGLEQIQEYLEGSLARSRRVFGRLMFEKQIDPARAGSFGISFGAVVNCLWAASEPRLRAHVFALAGGNLAEIFLSSRDPLMRTYTKAALTRAGGNKEKLREGLKEIFLFDPLEAAASLEKEKVLMVLALLDRVVRPRYGLVLRRALGNPKTIFLPLGHYFSILAAPILKWRALAFFKEKL